LQYRNFGETGFQVSLLGMGCMRLPFIGGDNHTGIVDKEAAYKLIRSAVANGVNYFDTAFGYHSGESEEILGEALNNGLREKVRIATKQPIWEMRTQSDIRRNLENTLRKLQTDYIDVYLLHRIMPASWGTIQEREIFKEFENFKKEGLIKHIGFSYHGDFNTFQEVLTRYPWEVCMIQQNLLDINREATEKGIKLAGKHGVGLVVMEPLRGGGLAQSPVPVKALYENYPIKRTPAEWAFRHLANYPEVSCVLSGMSTMEQLQNNVTIFSQSDMVPGCVGTAADQALLSAARDAYESIVTIPCTGCAYCVPCPHNVQIPAILSNYNDGHRFERFDQPRRAYMFASRAGGDATKCTTCGECIPKCPQNIDIPSQLQTAHDVLKGWTE